MSFDVQFQPFSATADMDQFLQRLASHVSESRDGFRQLAFDDGQADLYVDEEGTIASHVSGEAAWDVLVGAAREADLVILPPAGVVCLTRPEQADDLPDELRETTVVVSSGAGFLAAIADA